MANINIAGMDHAKIQEIITYTEYYPNLSRRTLANTICENLEWKTPAGSLKVNSCLSLLDKLEKQGEVKLKPLEKRVHNQSHLRRRKIFLTLRTRQISRGALKITRSSLSR